jgi:hypothetical protein
MVQKITKQPLFGVGQLVATPGALAALEKTGQSPVDFLTRHVTGDFGAGVVRGLMVLSLADRARPQ